MKFYLIYLLKTFYEYIFKKFPEHKDDDLDKMMAEYKSLLKRKRDVFFKLCLRRIRNFWKFGEYKWIITSKNIAYIIIIILLYNLYIKHPDTQFVPVYSPAKIVYVKDIGCDSRSDFLYQLAYVESRRDYSKCRIYKEDKERIVYSNYWGRYQLGKMARTDIDCNSPMHIFLNDSTLQEEYMLKWLNRVKLMLKKEIKEYNGKWIGNYYITESGLIAMAHLVGAGNVKKFLKKKGKYIPLDGNGKRGTDYLQQFGRYRLELK